jgi:hypothetical protein
VWDDCLEYVCRQAHSSIKSWVRFSLAPSNRAMKGFPMIDGGRVGRQYGRHAEVDLS